MDRSRGTGTFAVVYGAKRFFFVMRKKIFSRKFDESEVSVTLE